MKKFRERNLYVIAGVAAVVLLVATYIALNFTHLPLVSNQKTYRADFASALGLTKGDVVTIAGVRVGSISKLSLADSPQGQVAQATFTVSGGYRLGSLTTADAKIINPVGVEYIQLTPTGPGRLQGSIPLSRTTTPGTLTGDLNQLAANTQQTNIGQLTQSLEVVTQDLQGTAPATTKAAIDGVAELSEVLASHENQIDDLIGQADDLTVTLNSHSSQLINLLGQSNLVLQVLEANKSAINNLLQTTQQLAGQLNHIIVGDQAQLDPLINNLDSLSAFLSKDSTDVSQALPLLASFDRYAANVTGSGPFADVVDPTLVLPDNVFAACAKSASSINQMLGCRQ